MLGKLEVILAAQRKQGSDLSTSRYYAQASQFKDHHFSLAESIIRRGITHFELSVAPDEDQSLPKVPLGKTLDRGAARARPGRQRQRARAPIRNDRTGQTAEAITTLGNNELLNCAPAPYFYFRPKSCLASEALRKQIPSSKTLARR